MPGAAVILLPPRPWPAGPWLAGRRRPDAARRFHFSERVAASLLMCVRTDEFVPRVGLMKQNGGGALLLLLSREFVLRVSVALSLRTPLSSNFVRSRHVGPLVPLRWWRPPRWSRHRAFAWNIKGVKGDQHHGPVSGPMSQRPISSSQREVNGVPGGFLTTEDVKEYGAAPALQGFLRDLSLTLPFTTAHDVRLFEHTALISPRQLKSTSRATCTSSRTASRTLWLWSSRTRSVLPSRSSSPSTTPRSRASARSHKGTAGQLRGLHLAAMPTAGFSSRRALRGRVLHNTPRF